MSFSIYFYKNQADNITVDKSTSLTHKGTILLNDFRDNFDVYNPLLIIQADDEHIKTPNNAVYTTFIKDVASGEINYFSISASIKPGDSSVGTISRYYYLVSYYIIQNNIIAMRLHEDVLLTRKLLITSSYGIVSRNENSYNLLINDPKIKTYSDPVIRRKKFSYSFDTQNPVYGLVVASFKPQPVTSTNYLTVNILGTSTGTTHELIIWVPKGSFGGYRNTDSYSEFVSYPIGNWCIQGGDDSSTWGMFKVANVSGVILSKYYFETRYNYGSTFSIPIAGALPNYIYCWMPSGGSFKVNSTTYVLNNSNFTTAERIPISNNASITIEHF